LKLGTTILMQTFQVVTDDNSSFAFLATCVVLLSTLLMTGRFGGIYSCLIA